MSKKIKNTQTKHSHVIIFNHERKSWTLARCMAFTPTNEENKYIETHWNNGKISFFALERTPELEEWMFSIITTRLPQSKTQNMNRCFEVRPINQYDNIDNDVL